MLRSKSFPFLHTFLCGQCSAHISKRLATTQKPNPNTPKAKPSPPPLFSSSSPAPPLKQQTTQTKSPPPQPSTSQQKSSAAPLFPPPSNSNKSTPLFPTGTGDTRNSPTSSPAYTPPKPTSSAHTPPKPTSSPYTPPILTPKPRAKNSADQSTDFDEISNLKARENSESVRQEQFRLAQVKARNELFKQTHKEQGTGSEGDIMREMRDKAYRDLVRSSYIDSSPSPPLTPPPAPSLSKEELEKKKDDLLNDLDKYMDDYGAALADTQAKTTPPLKRAKPPTSASSVPPTSTPASPSSPPPSSSTSTPHVNQVNKNNSNKNNKKRMQKNVPGETGRFSRDNRAPRGSETMYYNPKPVNEREKVEREGEMPAGLETRASKVQQFLQYTQSQVAKGQLPDKSRMLGLFEVAVPKKDPMAENLKGFAEHNNKLKADRQKESKAPKERIKAK